jgi:RNA polymerase sigma-70 factor (ECF subfamily)
MVVNVNAASSESGDLSLPRAESAGEVASSAGRWMEGERLLQELWRAAEAERCGLAVAEFGRLLALVGARYNHGLPEEQRPGGAQREAFFRALRLPEFALAQGCALGLEAAWQRFMQDYGAAVRESAVAITRSGSLGEELSGSLYSELYGMRQQGGERVSPLASYAGRGSLMGWLRTTLVQRNIDRHRKTGREVPLGELEPPAPAAEATPQPEQLARLARALQSALRAADEEERFLLSSYFLDERPLQQIGLLLGVHEATISRRLKRTVARLRERLLAELQAGGMSRRQAGEALGADPRDVEMNLRPLLQSSQGTAFQEKTGGNQR